MPHPLENQSQLYSIANGQIALYETEENVKNSMVIGQKMVALAEFNAYLPGGFHATISSPIKTMEHLKKGIKIGDKIFTLEAIFLRLLTIGQQRQIELGPIFQFELGAVPPH